MMEGRQPWFRVSLISSFVIQHTGGGGDLLGASAQIYLIGRKQNRQCPANLLFMHSDICLLQTGLLQLSEAPPSQTHTPQRPLQAHASLVPNNEVLERM